jgi:hypothetical protein
LHLREPVSRNEPVERRFAAGWNPVDCSVSLKIPARLLFLECILALAPDRREHQQRCGAQQAPLDEDVARQTGGRRHFRVNERRSAATGRAIGRKERWIPGTGSRSLARIKLQRRPLHLAGSRLRRGVRVDTLDHLPAVAGLFLVVSHVLVIHLAPGHQV